VGPSVTVGEYPGYFSPVTSTLGALDSFPYAGYDAAIIVGMGISGPNIPNGTTILENVPEGATPIRSAASGTSDANWPIAYNNGYRYSSTTQSAGWYRARYASGSFNTSNGPGGAPIRIYSDSPVFSLRATSGYITAQEYPSQANVGQYVDFYHTGGYIIMQNWDTDGNNDGNVIYTFKSAPYLRLSNALSAPFDVVTALAVPVLSGVAYEAGTGSIRVQSGTGSITAGDFVVGFGIPAGVVATSVTFVSGTIYTIGLSAGTTLASSGNVVTATPTISFRHPIPILQGSLTLNQTITSGTIGSVSFSGQIYNLSVPNAGNVLPSAQAATYTSFTKAISYGLSTALSYPDADPRVITGMSVSSSDPGIVFASGSTTITTVSTQAPVAVIPSVTTGEYDAFGLGGTGFAPTSSVRAGLSSFPYLYNSGIVAGMSIAGANLQANTVITANVSGSSLTSSSLTVPATGAIVNFNASASYASGWYRVTHTGGYNTMFVGSGGVGGVGYDSSAIRVYSSGSEYRASSGYVGSQALAGYVDFYHTGGTIGLQAFQPSDLLYSSNVGHSASYTLSMAPYLQLSKSIPAPPEIINAISAISADSGSTMSYTMSASSVVIQSDQIEGIFFGDSVTGFGIPPNTTVMGISNKQTNGTVYFATIALSNATTLGSSDYKSTANPIISFQRPAGAGGQMATISQPLPSLGSGTITISSGSPSAAGDTLTFFRGQGYTT